MIFLDTHVVVWLYEGLTQRIPNKVATLIEEEDDIRISPMLEFELDLLFEINRISIGSKKILGYLEEKLGLEPDHLPFVDIIKQAQKLAWTRDPFDRLITATAALYQSKLITKDNVILANYRHAAWD